MALPSAFRERLEHMEHTRNQRLSLLQTERELQITKCQLLAVKHFNIRSVEQRCCKLDQKIASQQFAISSLKYQMHMFDFKYDENLHQMRVLKREVEELVQLEKEKEKFYSLKKHEMQEFLAQVDNFVVDCGVQVQELRNKVNELKPSFITLQEDAVSLNKLEIVAAEIRKSELVAAKENLDRSLASNYQIRVQLQKQLHSILLDKMKKEVFVEQII